MLRGAVGGRQLHWQSEPQPPSNKGLERSAQSQCLMLRISGPCAPAQPGRYAARNYQSCFTARSVIDIMPREEESTGFNMQGIQFVTNDKGEKVAVQIDLRKHAAVWEDV